MTNDELTEWGIKFTDELDRIYAADEVYGLGDVTYIMNLIGAEYPELEDEQMEWLEDFYAEA